MRTELKILAAAAALAACGALRAEPNPYSVGVSQGFGHDSNLYRTESAPVPDKYSITSLKAGVDQPFGRQRFYANGTVRATRYEDIVELNNTGYGVNAGLDWSTIEQLSGGINLALDKSLAQYGSSGNQPQLTKKNIQTTQQINGRVQLGLVSLLSLEGTLAHRRLGYSADEYAASEYAQNSGSLGLTYRPSGLLTLGTALRHTRGEYDNVVLANGEAASFSRNDLDLTATWLPSGLSTVNARLSFGRQTSDALTERNFSGTTGSLSWAFLPTGKLSFNTTLARDTGNESSFASAAGGLITSTGDNSRLTTSLSLTAAYAATAKIKINAGLRYSRRSLVDDQFVNGVAVQSAEGVDSLKTLTLGAEYAPTRNWQLGCNTMREIRLASGGLSNSYSATTANCSAQFSLQ
jgi:hypothetical protein